LVSDVFRISGAIYTLVPQCVLYIINIYYIDFYSLFYRKTKNDTSLLSWYLFRIYANPKSAILTIPTLLPSKIFSGFRSRWANCLEFIYSKAEN